MKFIIRVALALVLAAGMNPIIRRELLELLRTRKALVMQFGLALACALFVLVRWPTGDAADLTGARSMQVLRVFGYGLLACVLLLAPAFPATTLVREKIKGTLQLLLNSPMRPWSIYLGKLGGVLGFTAILLIMTLPAAAACYALGGSGVRGGITILYVLLGVAALQTSTLGLWVSSRANSTDGALRITYLLALSVYFLPMIPYELMRAGSDYLTASLTGQPPALVGFIKSVLALVAVASPWIRCLSPIPAVMEVLGQGDLGSHGMTNPVNPVGWYVVFGLVTSAVCGWATIRRLNHTMLDRTRSAGVMTQDRSAGQRAARRVLFLSDPQRRTGSMSLWVNPVMVKEFRSRRFGRTTWTLRFVGLSVILSLAAILMAAMGVLGWGLERVGGGLVLLQVVLLLLFAPSLSAGMVSAERESGTWQLLRMTPLSAGAVLRGKLLSVALPLVLLLCATLPGYGAMILLEPALAFRVQRVLVCLALTAVFVVLVSAAASTFFRSTAAAMTAAYVALLVVCALPLLIWLGSEAPFGRSTVEGALSITPVAGALQSAGIQELSQYELLPLNWWIIGGACLALLILLRVRTWQLCRPE
jgi:ABC-type transport system involved in multi-copper enzyme maturation permease subunit